MTQIGVEFIEDSRLSLDTKVALIPWCDSHAIYVLMDEPSLSLEAYIEIAKRVKSISMDTFIKIYNTVVHKSKTDRDFIHIHIYLHHETLGYNDSDAKEIISVTQRLLKENPYKWDKEFILQMQIAYEEFCDFMRYNLDDS